ncbi:hypothetical protein GLOIN_2v1882411 [Rhizophagus clarus]|uniref:Ion transport domain-containing protein n=1 Tax=Rhizophagus clarus TaxID=94130 RepID=A0A8H3L699_9GLOM|nr:hypothetical protein GLOIN_2v1882411 [Rhizophagus clarus]
MDEKDFKIKISNEIPSETKDDIFDNHRDGIEKHRKSISRIFVSQYINEYDSDDYIVTYSRKYKSVLGWSVHIEENGPPQPDVYFKHRNHDDLKNSEDAIGFLPNGDLIKVSVSERKIYKYSFADKPKNTDPWEYSQINDIEIPESLNNKIRFDCSIYRTKLFLIVDLRKMLQFDLLTMNLEKQYHEFTYQQKKPIIMNKNQTLLATVSNDSTYIYSMENGMLIYNCEDSRRVEFITLKDNSDYNLFAGEESRRVEFITLKDNSDRLLIAYGSECRLVDPYQVYDEIDVFDDFNETSVITKLNKKIFIDNGNVCVTNGIEIDENELHQLSHKFIYRNSIYTLPTFKIIRIMLKEIIDREDIKKVALTKWPEKIVLKDEVEIKNLGICKVVLYNDEQNCDHLGIEKNDGHLEKRNILPNSILSFKLLYNQDLGFKKDCGNDYNILIERILENEFDDSKHSIPFPKFIELRETDRKSIIDEVINDNFLSSKFGAEMLKIAIEEQYDDVVLKIIGSTQNYSENYMTIISLNLPKLCDRYPDFIIKYISCTSIMLSPYCNDIGYSLYSNSHTYTDIYIKESKMDDNNSKFILTLYKGLSRYLLGKEEEIQTVSFIVPFPQICVYHDDSKYNDHENHETENNHSIKLKIITILKKMITVLKIIMMIPKSNSIWNEFLYKPKSILFCNIDSNQFYNSWNFAAIVDYKWEAFGRVYYSIIWQFYMIFYICFSLASTLEQKSIPDFYFKLLYIISITFGSIFLIFEIRQCLWNYKLYFNDLWNLIDLATYISPINTSTIWLINKSPPLLLIIVSILFLTFKFLTFFRAFKMFGIHFSIIISVQKTIFPLTVPLFFMIFGYAQAFFIALRSNSINDDNDPQNLATKYDFVNPDGTINNTTTIVQEPDSNTNLFNWFPTSLLAVYKLLTGDSGPFSSFTYREHSIMTFLLVSFTFSTTIYLLNILIGLLNLTIQNCIDEKEFLLHKARIIMEIELFYMLPWQRNNKKWFPDWIYYNIPVAEIRELINAIDNYMTVFNHPPIISERLKKLVIFPDDNKQEKNNKLEELTKQNVELKQQIESIIKYIGVKDKKDNKLVEQTKEELPRELKEKMDNIEKKLENIMGLLSKVN